MSPYSPAYGMQANSLENISWPGGGGVGASKTSPRPHLYPPHSLLSFLPLGSFSIGFWISTSIPKLMYFPSFLFDMGVSWGGVTLTLLASAGMKKPCNKSGSLSYFWDETRRPLSGVSRWTSTEKKDCSRSLSLSLSLTRSSEGEYFN